MKDSVSPGPNPVNKNDQIISYFTLRVLIGAAGILLPVFLVIGKLVNEGSWDIEYSISDYYDNGTSGDMLVGILFALAFFLFSYKGYERIDSIAGSLGCIFALGVALFPTTSDVKFVHILHFVFAFLLFSVFIFFSIYLFRKSAPGKSCTRKKEQRNQVYLVCGIIMIFCIVGIAVASFLLQAAAERFRLVFVFETLALTAFGFSWITKAEFLFLVDSDTPRKKEAAG